MLVKPLEGGFGKSRIGFVVLMVEFFQKVFDQVRDFFLAFPQRGEVHRYHVDAVVQVFSKRAFGDGFLEVFVRRGDHAGIDLHVGFTSDPGKLSVLKDLEELGLQARADLADFVQKDRPVIGEFEFSGLSPEGAGERSFFIAEQLAFQQSFGKGGAQDLDEWLVLTERTSIQSSCHELLAGPAFPPDQHLDVRRRDLVDDHHDLLHLGAETKEVPVVALVPGIVVGERAFERGEADRFGQALVQEAQVQRFNQKSQSGRAVERFLKMGVLGAQQHEDREIRLKTLEGGTQIGEGVGFLRGVDDGEEGLGVANLLNQVLLVYGPGQREMAGAEEALQNSHHLVVGPCGHVSVGLVDHYPRS